MASGMATRLQSRTIGRAISAGLLSLLFAGSLAYAQDNAPAAPAPSAPAPQQSSPAPQQAMPAPFSHDCQVGDSTSIAEESPLPNVAAALQNRKQIKILAIGASSLSSRRSSRGGHTEQIKQILQAAIKGLDVVMINRGVSGELSAQAVPRIKNEVALTEPDLVLWQVGTNDALSYVPLDEIESSIVETIRWLKEHKVDVVLVGLQYVDRMAQDDHYRAVRELMRKVAAQEKVMIVRRYEAQRLLLQAEASGGGLVPDEFQRTETGYVCLSQYMARAITLGIFGRSLRVVPVTPPTPQQPPQPPPTQQN
jgi:acyl-CoA thioesterase I